MHRESLTDGGIYLGLLYFSVGETMFRNLCDLRGTVMTLPLFFKQRDVLYPAWAYTLPTCILKIPITLVEVTIWVSVTYYAVGFDPNIWRWALWIMNGHVPSFTIAISLVHYRIHNAYLSMMKLGNLILTLVQCYSSCKMVFLCSSWMLISWKKGSVMIVFCFHLLQSLVIW
jgi:hypothetical protein